MKFFLYREKVLNANVKYLSSCYLPLPTLNATVFFIINEEDSTTPSFLG